jgi:hypothetical protein
MNLTSASAAGVKRSWLACTAAHTDQVGTVEGRELLADGSAAVLAVSLGDLVHGGAGAAGLAPAGSTVSTPVKRPAAVLEIAGGRDGPAGDLLFRWSVICMFVAVVAPL